VSIRLSIRAPIRVVREGGFKSEGVLCARKHFRRGRYCDTIVMALSESEIAHCTDALVPALRGYCSPGRSAVVVDREEDRARSDVR